MELYIVRHGQSKAQTGEDSGPDPHLSALGLTQAEKLGKRLLEIKFDKIYASHLSRAVQTAAGVAKQRADSPAIEIIPELAECGFDPCYEQSLELLESYYPKIIMPRSSIGQGYKNDGERAEFVLNNYIYPLAYESGFTSKKDSNEGPVCSNDCNILIAAHGMFDAYLLGLLVNFPFDKNMVVVQQNTCINLFSLYTVDGVRRVKFNSFNDYGHLK